MLRARRGCVQAHAPDPASKEGPGVAHGPSALIVSLATFRYTPGSDMYLSGPFVVEEGGYTLEF